eukprot:12579706-Alexandrium_andersonii.AAC.1
MLRRPRPSLPRPPRSQRPSVPRSPAASATRRPRGRPSWPSPLRLSVGSSPGPTISPTGAGRFASRRPPRLA